MYIFKKSVKDEIKKKYKINYLCEQIGFSQGYFSLLMNGRISCPKTTAYCITKFLNSDAEIEDYFDIKEK